MKKYLILGTIAAVLGGPFLIHLGSKNAEKIAALASSGKNAEGIVIDGEQTSGGRRKSSKSTLEIQWTPEGKSPVTQTFTVSKSYWNEINKTGKGAKVPVRYLTANPQESAIIEGGTSISPENTTPGIAVTVVGVALAAGLVMMARKG